jgi:hypothetical protein
MAQAKEVSSLSLFEGWAGALSVHFDLALKNFCGLDGPLHAEGIPWLKPRGVMLPAEHGLGKQKVASLVEGVLSILGVHTTELRQLGIARKGTVEYC